VPALSGPRHPRVVKLWVWGVLLLAGAGACRKDALPIRAEVEDGGVAALPLFDGGEAPLPGPVARATGPRVAPPGEIHRLQELKHLKANRSLAPVASFIEAAVRDVYGSKAFAFEVEKATGEPLRPPQSLVLERLDVGSGPELWRVTYEAWCGRTTGGAAGYKSDHLLLSRAGGFWRVVTSLRPGCAETGEPEVLLLDLDGDGREEILLGYASTRLGAGNHLTLRWLKRHMGGFTVQPLLKESSPFQTLEVRYPPAEGGARDILFRTFREDAAGCAFFEVTVTYALDRVKGTYVRGREHLRPVPSRALVDEGEDIDPRCERK
jgi:hypothetical protein